MDKKLEEFDRNREYDIDDRMLIDGEVCACKSSKGSCFFQGHPCALYKVLGRCSNYCTCDERIDKQWVCFPRVCDIRKIKSTKKNSKIDCDPVEINRVFAMPNSKTFSIPPIYDFIREAKSKYDKPVFIDPFAKDSRFVDCDTNDLDPSTTAKHHMDALDFLKSYASNSVDFLLFDPPYSLRQLKEVYVKLDKSLSLEDTNYFWAHLKNEIARIIKKGGSVISFGWNSNGIGKNKGFVKKKILMVAHGGPHNDTICVLEQKVI